MRKKSETSGRFEKTYTDEDFTRAVKTWCEDPAVPAVEVARLLDCSRDFAKKKIKDMEEKGLLKTEVIGNMLFVRLPKGD